MPSELSIKDRVEVLRSWTQEVPSWLREQLGTEPFRFSFGEKHGSWFLQVEWQSDGIARIAELAFTNATSQPDESSDTAHISARAAASTEDRYVIESIYDRRRSVGRVDSAQLETWLTTAIRRAQGFTSSSLLSFYMTGPTTAGR